MTELEKRLLTIDLCTRVPYGVECECTFKEKITDVDGTIGKLTPLTLDMFINGEIECKPYLRPMSSMTEEEMKEYNDTVWDLDKQDVIIKAKEYQENYLGKYPNSIYENPWIPWYHHIDWLNAHHFDYRGLISMGLALEAPEGMYEKLTNHHGKYYNKK